MDRCSDPSLVKILISTAEYQRLLHIEKKYLDIEKGPSSTTSSKAIESGKKVTGAVTDLAQSAAQSTASEQIGGGQWTDLLKKLPELTFDFLLDKGIYAFQNTPSNSTSTKETVKEQFLQFLSKALVERFGIPPLFGEGVGKNIIL